MARIPEAELERLKRETSLPRLIKAAGVVLEKRGADLVGLCPFHDDHEPSLSVSPAKNLWRCFGCEAGGDVIAWVMKAEGVSFRHAVELLREDADLGATRLASAPKLPPLAADPEDAAGDAKLLAQVLEHYRGALKRSLDAQGYLERRGIADAKLIERFGLGFADRTLGYRLPDKTRKAGAEIRGRLQRIGLFRESGHEHFAGSLVIPIVSPEGFVGQVYGRKVTDRLRKGTPLHLYLPGPLKGVFNAEAVASCEEIILCEALIDALTFWAAGFRHVTAAFGAGGVTDELLAALEAGPVKRVLIAFDRDAAGDAGAEKLAPLLTARGIDAYRVLFPKGMDANAYALAVKPAPKSLAALLRAAEWLGKGSSKPRPAPAAEPLLLAAGSDDPAADPAPELAPLSAPVLAPVAAPPAEPAAVKEHEVTLALGDRTWRARGLARNMSYEALRVSLQVRRGEAFHLDALDLFSAKAREAFVRAAAAELALPAEAVKADLGRVLLLLEGLQDEMIQAQLAPKPAVPAMTAAERDAALALLRDEHLLDRIAADVAALGVVGEARNVQAAYLAAVSRKLEKPLAVLIQSTSAAGKSALMDAVLDLVPEEERVAYSAMTGQSLFYLGETEVAGKVLAIAEEEGVREASYALKLLQSQGALTIASTGKDPVTGKLVTQEYRVQGPVALMLTTTAIDLDEELANRCFVLAVDESRDQTAAIHAAQRRAETLEGLKAKAGADAVRQLHRNAQRLLKPLAVVNPFAERLAFRADQTRARRDHAKYLRLIQAVALLHQHQRPIKRLERPDAEPIEYVEATLADVAAAHALAHAVLGRTLDELPPQTRRLLSLIHAHVAARAAALGIAPAALRFTRRELREATAWGWTQLKAHLHRLEELEYLLLRPAPGGGRRFVYELAYAGEGEDGAAFLMGLADLDALAGDYDARRSGPEGAWSAHGRPAAGAMSAAGRDGDHAGLTSDPGPRRLNGAGGRAAGSSEDVASYMHVEA